MRKAYGNKFWIVGVVLLLVWSSFSVSAYADDAGGAEGQNAADPTYVTNNVDDYRTDTNVIDGGRWSYLDMQPTSGPGLLVKGDGVTNGYTTDSWVVDLNKPEHTWFVKAGGIVQTDGRGIAYNYTVDADGAGPRLLRLHGSYTSPAPNQGTFRILKTSDTSETAVTGGYTTLFEHTTGSTGFDLTVLAEPGNDLLFVASGNAIYWSTGTLNATISRVQADPVTADIPSGEVSVGQPVALSTAAAGASIYYTTDGSDPKTSQTRTLYASPIVISADTTIKAYAAKSGWLDGETATFVYTVAAVNPSSSNIANFSLESNVVAPGVWSYLQLAGGLNAPALLKRGNGGTFGTDVWTSDNNYPYYTRLLKGDGTVLTDGVPIVYNYTVSAEWAAYPVRIQGSFGGVNGRFRILKSTDTDPNAVLGPYETLLDYTGSSKDFKFQTDVEAGNDILFVGNDFSNWWTPGKIDATVVSQRVPQAEPVTANPAPADALRIHAGDTVTLTTATAGAAIFYTTDGSDPRTSATKQLYSGPIAIANDTLLKATARKSGWEASDVGSFRYVIDSAWRNFLGVAQGSADASGVGGIKWDRHDLDWNWIEPTEGQINQQALDYYKKLILDEEKSGIHVLPVLGYSATWAVDRDGYTYTHKGLTYEVGPVESEVSDGFIRDVTVKDAAGQTIETRSNQKFTKQMSPIDPAKVNAWKAYVQLIVDTFSAAPYNLEYFQVWNEAYPTSGFWYGGLDQYMEDIHLPAAEVIHEANKKVVYGGWISGAPVGELTDLLDKWHAWDSVDVFDLHYHSLSSMQLLYDKAQQNGIEHPSIWQTEIGFTNNYGYIPNFYPRVFRWALEHEDPSNPDQFKLFYFAYWSPNDPNAYGYGNSIISGSAPSSHGKALIALGKLLHGNTIQPFDDFATWPELHSENNENLSSVEGFLVDGKRAVLAFHIAKQYSGQMVDFNGDGDAYNVYYDNFKIKATFNNLPAGTTVKRVDLLGNETPLTLVNVGGGQSEAAIPVADSNSTAFAINQPGIMTFYLVVESPQPLSLGD